MPFEKPFRHLVHDVQTLPAQTRQARQNLVREGTQAVGEMAAGVPLEIPPLSLTKIKLAQGHRVVRPKDSGVS